MGNVSLLCLTCTGNALIIVKRNRSAFFLAMKGVLPVFTIGNDRVALVTDTSCDLSDEQLAAYDIRYVCLRVTSSKGEFRDRTEISQDALYALLKEELPKTSLPLPEDVSALYRQLQSEGCTRVLHLSMSSGLSGTYNMVRIMAGTYALAAAGKLKEGELARILSLRDRSLAGDTAPAHGLYLNRVFYPEEYGL